MKYKSFVLLTFFFTVVKNDYFVEGYMVDKNPYHRREVLDTEGKYQLEWRVDWSSKQITFNVSVQTRGYVGFGLSYSGKMSGADIVIGGVMPTGEPYFSDRHAVYNQLPEMDSSQDWTLETARENKTHTFLSFSRFFDTCDPQDYPITKEKIALIWAFGEKDNEIEYHHQNRGFFYVYLLNPDYTPLITRHPTTGAPVSIGDGNRDDDADDDGKVWTISRKITMPSVETTYICTMHAAPNISSKHHLIGFEVRFPIEEHRVYVHHLDMYRCHVPRGLNLSPQSVFGPFEHHRGQTCYLVSQPTGPMPTEYCTEPFNAYSQGGRVVFHPPHVGVPFYPGEYFVLQSHYNNPNQVSGKTIELHIDYFYTSKLRANDIGLLIGGRRLPGMPISSLLPPSSIDQVVHGHCSEGCTRTILPKRGIKIVTALLHAHSTARRLKLHHFRNGRELPWILSEDNFKFDFQQVRVINREVHVLPGDQLTTTCIYDNTLANNGSTVGGFSATQEMCLSFVWYYTRLRDHGFCWSDQDSLVHRRRFLAGVTNVTWQDDLLQYTVDQPHRLAGLTVKQVSDNHVNWNLAKREENQRFRQRHPHNVYCSPELYSQDAQQQLPLSDISKDIATYPYGAVPYIPNKTC